MWEGSRSSKEEQPYHALIGSSPVTDNLINDAVGFSHSEMNRIAWGHGRSRMVCADFGGWACLRACGG
jgi:hypothetical protein